MRFLQAEVTKRVTLQFQKPECPISVCSGAAVVNSCFGVGKLSVHPEMGFHRSRDIPGHLGFMTGE